MADGQGESERHHQEKFGHNPVVMLTIKEPILFLVLVFLSVLMNSPLFCKLIIINNHNSNVSSKYFKSPSREHIHFLKKGGQQKGIQSRSSSIKATTSDDQFLEEVSFLSLIALVIVYSLIMAFKNIDQTSGTSD